MKKKHVILLCIIISIFLILLIVFVYQNHHRYQGEQQTVSEADVLLEEKETALLQIEDAYIQLSDDEQQNCKEYIEQAKNNIENAETERTIQAVLYQTLEYLQNIKQDTTENSETVSNSIVEDNSFVDPELYPLGKEKDGRCYTPISNPSNWEYLSEAKQESITEKSIPVLEDENHTIDVICQDLLDSFQTYSYTLSTELGLWCEEQGIKASEGEYLAYGTYQDNYESFYLALDDEEETVLLATYYKKTISWKFERTGKTKEEIMQRIETEEGDAGLPE